MKTVILDADTLGRDMDLSVFRKYGEVQIYPTVDDDEIADCICDADVVVVNKKRIDRETAGDPQRLRLIAVTATGYDNIDLAFCREKGIAVTNVKGYSTDCVAQITVTMALSLIANLSAYTSYVNSGAYTESGIQNCLTPTYHEIAGKTWGIFGLGNIGKRVAAIARAMGCRVICTKRTPEEGYECVPLDTLCRESDILSVHTPLTSETRGAIDEHALSLMKPTSILINVARGAVLDEASVTDAVLSGRIGGFASDVYSTEPFPKDSPYAALLGRPNVLLTPHMAWGGYETRVRLIRELCLNIEDFLRGGTRNRVDLL